MDDTNGKEMASTMLNCLSQSRASSLVQHQPLKIPCSPGYYYFFKGAPVDPNAFYHCDIILVALTKDCLSNLNFISAIENGCKMNRKFILVHHASSPFPN